MKAIVLGAGLQGISASLSLARRGWDVELIERDPECMLRASLRNEGKLHLGLTYARDTSLRTAERMLDAAFAFSRIVDRWAGRAIDWRALTSRPFTYLVMTESLISADDVEDYFAAVDRLSRRRPTRDRYLDRGIETLYRRVAIPEGVTPDAVTAAFETAERAIDLPAFRALMTTILASTDAVTLRTNHTVAEVARSESGFAVRGTARDGSPWLSRGDIVVNCLWDQRLLIDRTVTAVPERPWTFRRKYRVLGRLSPQLRSLPALTMVLGPFGDIVPMPSGSYLSWYPECRRGMTSDLAPPSEWDGSLSGDSDLGTTEDLAGRVLDALARVVPAVRDTHVTQVDAGIVFSWGHRDIDDYESEFHERHDVGIAVDNGFFSIDTGKLGYAPLFGEQVAGMVG